METEYTKYVGTKFYADGNARAFPGNTIICPFDTHDDLCEELKKVQKQFMSLPVSSKYGFLPPDSFHMTVFDLVCDQVRKPKHWSKYLPLDMPLEETDRFFKTKLAELEFIDDITMHIDSLRVASVISVALIPDEKTNEKIRGFRDELAHLTGVRHPNHDEYIFHITLAYNLVHLSNEERKHVDDLAVQATEHLKKTFPLIRAGMPRLVYFPDMFSFPYERIS